MRKYLIIASSIMLAGCVSTTSDEPGNTPNPSLSSSYGEVGVRAGSSVDIAVYAGGHIDVAGYGGAGCTGFIYDRPDYVVNYETTGATTFSIGAVSATDTTIAVYTPGGGWICDDNSGDGNNPLLRIARAPAGRYAIWVGTRTFIDSFPPATLQLD